MYKKIQNPEDELLFTHAHQRELEKPNPVLLDSVARAEMYIANTFVHLHEEAIHALMLSTRGVLLESRKILPAPFRLKELTPNLLISHVIQASATRLILVYHQPSKNIALHDANLLAACQLKSTLLEYSLLLDDFFLTRKTAGKSKHVATTSLARLGLV